MNFRKTILAVSLSACTGAAMAADKTPTLGEVLKASGVTVNGYIDYSYNDLSTDAAAFRAYDTERRGFNLQMVDLSVGYQPASGFGGFVELNYGSDAQVNAAAAKGFPALAIPLAENSDAQQAYLQYASGPFTVMAGRFDTLAGAEVIQAPNNTNFSRSLLFFFEPAFHTGVRASYAASDALKFTAGLNNGWNVLKKSNKAPGASGLPPTGNTLELGVSASPAKILSLSAAYYTGQETGVTDAGTRSLLDLVATVNATDALSFVLSYDSGKQEHGQADGSDAKWDGLAGYANYKFSDKWRVSLRTEKFKDKDGFMTGFGSSQTLKENTLTVGYAPASSLELRAEYRKDKSDQQVFTENGVTDKTTQNSLALEAVYKF